MSSNQEIFNNFMNSIDLSAINGGGFDLLLIHKYELHKDTRFRIVNGNTGVCLDYSNLNKKTKILFPSIEQTPDLLVRCNLCSIFPYWDKSNKLVLKFNNKEGQILCNIFLTYLVDSHISSIFEEPELEGYKKDKINKKKDIFLPEKIAGLEAIKAIRNKNRKKFKKNFKKWKKFVMTSQEDIEDTVMDGDLYSEEKPKIGWYGGSIETNEEAYRKICDINKNMYNEFLVVDMIAEKVGWW